MTSHYRPGNAGVRALSKVIGHGYSHLGKETQTRGSSALLVLKKGNTFTKVTLTVSVTPKFLKPNRTTQRTANLRAHRRSPCFLGGLLVSKVHSQGRAAVEDRPRVVPPPLQNQEARVPVAPSSSLLCVAITQTTQPWFCDSPNIMTDVFLF